MDSNKLQISEMNSVLELTESIINCKYLSFLTNSDTYQIRAVTMNELAIDINKHCKLFHLKKFIYDTNENFLTKLITVVNVAYALKGTIVTTIRSNGDYIDFYIGIVAKDKKGESGNKDREALLNAFEGTILGNFGGSDICCMNQNELLEYSETLSGNAVCSVSVVPSLRNSDEKEIMSYVQGIENLVDSLKGKKYTLITIADPVGSSDISEIRHGYENIYNYLVPLYRVVETKGVSETISLSQTDTESYVKGLTEGIARTKGRSDSVSTTNGFNLGVSAGVPFVVSVSGGYNHSKTKGSTVNDSLTENSAISEQFSKAKANTSSVGNTTSDSTQITVENRIIKSMLDKIEKNIERLDECEGYGAFNSATYILAEDKETALNVAGNFISLMKGERTGAQTSGINCWEKPERVSTYRYDKGMATFDNIISCLKHFTHPTFKVNESVSVSTSTMVSGPELTVQLGFPKKSINGVTVLPMNPFGRNVRGCEEDKIQLGNLYFMGRTESQEVDIEINSLASHVLVTGSTGKGKSNVIYGMLSKLVHNNVKFMVIEPAKGEYKTKLGKQPGVITYVTNPNFSTFISDENLSSMDVRLLKMNPFRFPGNTHVLEHIDRLIGIFNVCWPMYAAMPAILKDAVERAYEKCGWNLEESTNKFNVALYPSFTDVISQIRVILDESDYSADNKGDYIGSLSTRLKSLTTGINGLMLCADDWEDDLLFDSNVIVDLSRIGSPDTKALLMGILVIKLQEYRMQNSEPDSPLKHITVLEEAHNLIKKTSTEQTAEGANVAGKSVEMLSNAIAEMRTYGEGFIIVDQSPGLLDKAVIRNTNTKILLNLPDIEDRKIVGKAAGLTDNQIDELTKLERGVAVVHQSDWLEAVLCRFEKYDSENDSFPKDKNKEKDFFVNTDEVRDALLDCIMTQELYRKGERVLIGRLQDKIIKSKLSTEVKSAYMEYVQADEKTCVHKLKTLIYEFFSAEKAVDAAKRCKDIESWSKKVVANLSPSIESYSTNQLNIVLSMIIYEQSVRDSSYDDIFCRYTEIAKEKGGIF